MNKIHRYIRILTGVSILLIIGIITATTIRWFSDLCPQFLVNFLSNFGDTINTYQQDISNMPLADRIFGFLIDSIGFVLAYFAIIHFIRLMKQFQARDFFSINVIRQLHALNKLALYWILYTPLRGMLLSVITTLHRGPGNRILALTFSTSDLINIFIFLCLTLVTLVMQEGSTLKKEQDLTI